MKEARASKNSVPKPELGNERSQGANSVPKPELGNKRVASMKCNGIEGSEAWFALDSTALHRGYLLDIA